MFYKDHALLSAKKFDCNVQDTLQLHKIMDSSKNFFPQFQHRIFSHNLWFISVVVELIGDTVPNTKTGGELSVRDVLFEHLREDHNGHTPDLKDWLSNIRLDVKPESTKWFNNVNSRDVELLKELKHENN